MRTRNVLFAILIGAFVALTILTTAAAVASFFVLGSDGEPGPGEEAEQAPVAPLLALLGIGPARQSVDDGTAPPQEVNPPATLGTPVAEPLAPVSLEDAVKAAKRAAPEDLKTIQDYLDASGGDLKRLRSRVVDLLKGLSQDPTMQDPTLFAERAADIVNLANQAHETSYLYKTKMRYDLAIQDPAIGFDFGPTKRPGQPGFERIGPDSDFVNKGTNPLITGDGPPAVYDGLMDLTEFSFPLKDGKYRVTLLTLPEDQNLTPRPFGTSVQAGGVAIRIKDALNSAEKLYATLTENDFYIEDVIPEMPDEGEEVSAVALSVPVEVSGGIFSILLNPGAEPTYVTALVIYPEEEETIEEETAEEIAEILAKLNPEAGRRILDSDLFQPVQRQIRQAAATPGTGTPTPSPGTGGTTVTPPAPPSGPVTTSVPPPPLAAAPAPTNRLQAIATGPAEVLLGEAALLNGCDTLFDGQSLAAAFGGACEAGTLTGFGAEWFFNGELLGSGFLFSMATGPGTPFDVPGIYEITLLVTFFGDGTTPILTSVTTILIRVVAQAPVPEPGQLLILLAGLLGSLLWWRRHG